MCENQATATPDCFVHMRESCWTGASVRRNFFVIGSVREPCSQYVSLWAFGSAGKGAFSSMCTRPFSNDSKIAQYCEMLGTSSPLFDSAKDVLRFQRWVQHPHVMGAITDRFNQSYIDDDGAAHVDCWVVVDRFMQTLVGCLRAFEAQGGRVNWKTLAKVNQNFTYQHFDVAAVNQNLTHRTLMLSMPPPIRPPPHLPPVRPDSVSKNSLTVDPREMHHAPCSHYFDEKTAHAIEHGPDAVLYDDFRGSGVGRFGFLGCCKGSF